MRYRPENFIPAAKDELGKDGQRNFVLGVAEIFNLLCDMAMGSYGDAKAQDEARSLAGEIRSESLTSLAALLEELERNASRNGMRVLWAEDAEEACRLVGELIEKHGVKLITKGKSMLSEEIGLNRYLEKKYKDLRIFEGDLGELIVQQKDVLPMHIVGPAIHLTVPQIAETLSEKIGMPYTENASEMVAYVRSFLREKFQGADMGITGVNQAVASTGSLLVVENEGNIRWVTSAPKVHVALMSIEKVSANMSDALYLLGLLTRNCTGQPITGYLSVLNGPKRADEGDGPEEMYLVIIDNKRSQAYLDKDLKEVLRCIRCGRCGVQCPVYLRIGANPYGWCYPGPMGNALSPLILGLDRTKDFYEACTLCGACQEICPTRLPHLALFKKYRSSRSGRNPLERGRVKMWSFAVQHPRAYRTGLKLGRIYLKKNSRNGYLRKLPGIADNWLGVRRQALPPAMNFRDIWKGKFQQELAKLYKGKQDGEGQNGP